MLYTNASEGLVLEERVTFELDNCEVYRASLDADGDAVVALNALDPSAVKVTLAPGAATLLLIRKFPGSQSFGYSYRRAFRLRGRL